MTALNQLKSKSERDAIENAILFLWFNSEPEETSKLNAAWEAAEKLAALRAENERLRDALFKIAAGNGAYGQQASEYKEIARAALGVK